MKGRANEETEWQEEKELGRRMPPLSSPVPRLSSAPSDVYTVHTIASRSPPHPLATSHRVREGRPPRPVQGDAAAIFATTSPANSSHRASPRRSAILPASFNSSSILQVVREGQRASQGGPPLPAHPVYPLHPAGEDRHRPASHFWRFGEHIPQTRTN